MKNDVTRMIVSVAVAAVAFIFTFVMLEWNLIVCAFLSAGIYFGLYFLLKPSRKIAGIDVEKLPGGEEISRMLDDAEEDLKAMRDAASGIKDKTVREDAEALYATGKRIMDYLDENPKKIKMARRFFIYYLDTAAKLTDRYVDFQDTELNSDEVRKVLNKTAAAITVLNNAFEKQFIKLMEGELMDVESDIELLESTLKMEG